MDESIAAEIIESLESILHSDDVPEVKFQELSAFFHSSIQLRANSEGINFRNFYAQYRYILAKSNLSTNEQMNLEAFRRFSNQKLGIAGSSGQILQQAAHVVIRLVESIWTSLKGVISTKTIQPYIPNFFLSAVPTRDYSKLKDLRILSVGKRDVQPNNQTLFKIVGYDLDNMVGLIEIHINHHDHTDFSYIASLLLDNTIIHLKRLTQLSSDPLAFRTNFDSLIILEPDYLLDATSIGECFQEGGESAMMYSLKLVVEELGGPPALKGSMIGNYLDRMIMGNDVPKDQLFHEVQRSNALQAARFGLSEMNSMRLSIEQEHLPNIKGLIGRYRNQGKWIEPTYFSSEYGLQGRIDLLIIDQGAGTRHVLELKSGGSPNPAIRNAWRGHEIQVVCYSMLLESTYKNSTSTNSLFYSCCQIIPERNIIAEHREKQNVLRVRNLIVSSIWRLSLNDYSPLFEIIKHGIPFLPGFHVAKIERFQANYRPNTITSLYYNELIAFTIRELIFAKIGSANRQRDDRQQGLSSIWLDDVSKKKARYSIMTPLIRSAIDREKGLISFSFPETLEHAFRKGDLVIVYPDYPNAPSPLSNHILKGSIDRLDNNSVTVSLNNKQTDYSFVETFANWTIERDIFETNYMKTISCLFHFLSSPERKRRLLLGDEEPRYSVHHDSFDKDLTADQNAILNLGLNAEDYFLLQGPPGSGKTSFFLIKYLQNILSISDSVVVVLAFTNKATDKICENLRNPKSGKPIPYVRLGGRYTKDEYLFEELLLENNADSWRTLLRQSKVLVSTVAKFQNNLLVLQKLVAFKQIIIDEASQLTEADLSGILCLFEKFVLIGDHNQLPAVIAQDESDCFATDKRLSRFGVDDLRTSLFERLFTNAKNKNWHHAFAQLTDHYRMHEEIAELIQDAYDQKLKAYKIEQQTQNLPKRFNPNGYLGQLNESRTVFIEAQRGAKNVNIHEAKIIADIVAELTQYGGLAHSDIGIITPYRAQIFELKRQLAIDSEILIDTVERFQGDERKVIIFSTTVNTRSQLRTIESISNKDTKKIDRKLLVTLSRAEEQIIILGDVNILSASTNYAKLIRRLKVVSIPVSQTSNF